MSNYATAIRPAGSGWRVQAANASPAVARVDLKWDLLLLCTAAYLLTAVGRIHQLFPVLALLRPATLAGLVALALYFSDPLPIRRAARIWGPTAKYLIAMLV